MASDEESTAHAETSSPYKPVPGVLALSARSVARLDHFGRATPRAGIRLPFLRWEAMAPRELAPRAVSASRRRMASDEERQVEPGRCEPSERTTRVVAVREEEDPRLARDGGGAGID